VYVLLSFSLSSKKKESDLLFEAFIHISKHFQLEKKELWMGTSNINRLPRFTKIASPISFDLMSHETKDKKTVRLQDAVNTRSAEMIIPYPPGVPLWLPGEMITSDMLEYVQKLSELGARFQGASDIHLKTLQVYHE